MEAKTNAYWMEIGGKGKKEREHYEDEDVGGWIILK
jgi:hypothetical protein